MGLLASEVRALCCVRTGHHRTCIPLHTWMHAHERPFACLLCSCGADCLVQVLLRSMSHAHAPAKSSSAYLPWSSL